MPPFLLQPELAGLAPWQWIGLAIAIALAALAGGAFGRLATVVACKLAREHAERMRTASSELRWPLRFAAALGVVGVLSVPLAFHGAALVVLGRIYAVSWVIAAAWAFLRLVDLGARHLAERAAERDGWRARGVRTRVMIMRRVINAIGFVVLAAAFLMQFDGVRQLGVSLLASAGVAGVVVGLAAQRSIGNLLAGVQLSFTQPLRVGDKVVIQDKLGTVEEVNLTFVVIELWDQRRLIVPMAKLLESAFENWTRSSEALLGEVKVMVDFGTPFATIREDVVAFVKAHPLFDGRTCTVQITDAKDKTVELRVLVSAANADALSDLQCATREHLIVALQDLEHGRYLPRVRVFPSAQRETGSDAAAAE